MNVKRNEKTKIESDPAGDKDNRLHILLKIKRIYIPYDYFRLFVTTQLV